MDKNSLENSDSSLNNYSLLINNIVKEFSKIANLNAINPTELWKSLLDEQLSDEEKRVKLDKLNIAYKEILDVVNRNKNTEDDTSKTLKLTIIIIIASLIITGKIL